MSKFTCLVLCVIAVNLRSIYAEESDESASDEDWGAMNDKCLKKYGLKQADVDTAVQAGDASKVNSCYWGCYFNKVGLINDKGEYDLDGYLTTMKKLVANDENFARLESLGKLCTSVKDKPVNDGEAGCEMGVLVAACFIKYENASR